MKLTLRNTVPARDQSEIKKTNWIAHAEWKKCKSPKGRAQIDSLRPKKVPYSLCRDVMARACTESNQRSKGKLEAQLPFKIPPILHTYTIDVYRYKTIESIGKNFVTFVTSVSKKRWQSTVLYDYCELSPIFWNRLYSSFFHIDSIGITYV